MGFGWRNCAVKSMSRNAERRKRGQQLAELEKQFRRLFKVNSDCDEGGLRFPAACMQIDTASWKPGSEADLKYLCLTCESVQSAAGRPRRIEIYAGNFSYGFSKKSGAVEAVLDAGGQAISLTLRGSGSMYTAPADAGLVRRLLKARNASILFKGPEFSQDAGPLKLDGLEENVRSGLSNCFKP
jgi:hypothetical protein